MARAANAHSNATAGGRTARRYIWTTGQASARYYVPPVTFRATSMLPRVAFE